MYIFLNDQPPHYGSVLDHRSSCCHLIEICYDWALIMRCLTLLSLWGGWSSSIWPAVTVHSAAPCTCKHVSLVWVLHKPSIDFWTWDFDCTGRFRGTATSTWYSDSCTLYVGCQCIYMNRHEYYHPMSLSSFRTQQWADGLKLLIHTIFTFCCLYAGNDV